MSGFHDVRFPEDIAYGSSGGPQFSTQVTTVQNGFEQRTRLWAQPLRRYNVAYGVRDDSQLEALLAFFMARQGRAYGFRFKDWSDYQSCPVGGTITATDQVLGVGDGATLTFALVKQYLSGGFALTRPVTRPVAGSVQVALDGAVQAAGWTVDSTSGVITFTTPPGVGVAVSAGFAFDVPVRFDADYLATSLDSYGVGSVADIACVEVRD